ncbi:chloride channel protein [Planctomycetales bacterium]|nr:chloride channel protein [Planctomycetales bacterium]
MIPFEFAEPVYLLLLPAVFVLYKIAGYSITNFSKRQQRIHLLVRSLLWVLLVLALAGLSFHYQTPQKQFVFLIDESKSIDQTAAAKAEQYITAFKNVSAKINGTNKPLFVPFAATPQNIEVKTAVANNSDWQNATDIQAALKYGLTLLPDGKVPHVVLLSDGNDTSGDDKSITEFIKQHQNIPVSVVPLFASDKPEVAVAEISIPQHIRQGEPFFVETVIQSNTETAAEIILNRGEETGKEIIVKEKRNIHKGKNVFRFRETAPLHTPLETNDSGKRPDYSEQLNYSVSIVPESDTIPENNAAACSSFTAPIPRILIIENEPAKIYDFVSALQGQGFDVETGTAENMPQDLQNLDRFDGVIFSNVPARSFTPEKLEILRQYVEILGGGFLMLGGENSFGLGGYKETPVEKILPVKCDADENEKLPLAMALVIDRSGSMGGEKMELAKEAVKSAIGLLQKKDFISVVAFDHASYVIAPIQSAENGKTIKAAVSTIEAAGGTNIYPALDDAFKQLRSVNAKIKHIILLSDGYSVPGDYTKTVEAMTNEKITVSTIGVGDADNSLLKNIAVKGKGRHYTCTDPKTIPEIFAQETLAASKTILNEETFLPALALPSNMLSGIELDTLPPLLGYVVLEAKPAAQVILAAENGDPLLAQQRAGLGMSAVFTSDTKSKWGSEWLAWQEFPKFWSQVLRHIIRPPEQRPDERFFSIQKQIRSGKVYLTLNAVDENGHFINNGKVMTEIVNPAHTSEIMRWKQTAPGKYEMEFNAEKSGGYRFQTEFIDEGRNQQFRQNRTVDINYPDEFLLRDTNTVLLKEMAEKSGGLFDPSAEQLVRHDNKRTVRRTILLMPFLLTFAALLYVFDVFLKRMELFKNT